LRSLMEDGETRKDAMVDLKEDMLELEQYGYRISGLCY
jgi:hypothetical protein